MYVPPVGALVCWKMRVGAIAVALTVDVSLSGERSERSVVPSPMALTQKYFVDPAVKLYRKLLDRVVPIAVAFAHWLLFEAYISYCLRFFVNAGGVQDN